MAEVVVTVSDFGEGCPFEPTADEPPGLGLSMMSELSEALSISSVKHAGTTIDATIRIPSEAAEDGDRLRSSEGSRFDFHDPAFLKPVISRAIAVHASHRGGSIDAVRAAIDQGREIASAIEPGPVAAHGATLSIDGPNGSSALSVAMGPMPELAALGLRDRLLTRLHPSREVRVETTSADPSQRRVLVALPLS